MLILLTLTLYSILEWTLMFLLKGVILFYDQEAIDIAKEKTIQL